LDVGVVDVEPGPLEGVAVIDFGSVDLLHALRVNHELYLAAAADVIITLGAALLGVIEIACISAPSPGSGYGL
jgi:hypothetical protein